MVSRSFFFFSIALVLSGCAEVLGLDNGQPLEDDAGLAIDDVAAEGGASVDADLSATTFDAASDDAGDAAATLDDDSPDSATLTCPPAKADCNGDEKDGCETNLDDPKHCGSCTNACGPKMACRNESCCSNPHAPCDIDSDCCSGQCTEDSTCK